MKANILFLMALASCSGIGGDKVSSVQVTYLDTDTTLSSNSQGDHSQESILKISKSGGAEERAIVRLPTKKVENKDLLDDSLKEENPVVAVMLLPFIITREILRAILDLDSCDEQLVKPANLKEAKLKLKILRSPVADLSGHLSIQPMGRPWWQGATWDWAHPFSQEGRWLNPGGDLSADAGLVLVQNEGLLEIEMTTLFKNILESGQETHYGYVLLAKGDLDEVELASVQSSTYDQRPKVVHIYEGSCKPDSSKSRRVTDLGEGAVESEYILPQNALTH